MIKLYIVTKKMNAKLSSKTNVYMDFEHLTFCQLLKKTLYKKIYMLFEIIHNSYSIYCNLKSYIEKDFSNITISSRYEKNFKIVSMKTKISPSNVAEVIVLKTVNFLCYLFIKYILLSLFTFQRVLHQFMDGFI